MRGGGGAGWRLCSWSLSPKLQMNAYSVFFKVFFFSLWNCCGCSPRLGHGSSSTTPTDCKLQSLSRAQPPAVDPMVLPARAVVAQKSGIKLHCYSCIAFKQYFIILFYFILFLVFAPRVHHKKLLYRGNVATLLGVSAGGVNFIFCRISSLEASSCLISLTILSHLSMIASAGCSAECLSAYIF